MYLRIIAHTNIMERAQMTRNTMIVAVANHKGGCGKTTTVVNLAAELGRLKMRVLVVDMDPQANASLHIGKRHPSEIAVTCAELLLSELERLPQAIDEDTMLENVSLIYGSLELGRTEDELREQTPRPSEELRHKLQPLQGLYDIILIDTPPSLKLLTSNALAVATHVIIPIESGSQYGLYGVSDLMRHCNKIRKINPDLILLGALLIRHDERQTVCKLVENAALEQIGKLIPVKIPTSTKVAQAAIAQSSIHSIDRTSKVAREFKELARWLTHELGFKIAKDSINDQ